MSKNYLLKENVVLLVNGKFPEHKNPLEILINSNYIICCDGAANSLLEFGKKPNMIIGDLDSINDRIKKDYIKNTVKIENQNSNDLRKSLEWISENLHLDKLYILGSTGLREDHMIGNITTFLYNKFKFEIEIVTDTGVFHIINIKKEVESFNGQYISLFSIDPNQKIQTTGLKYDLDNTVLKKLYSGTLNISKQNKIIVKTKSENPILLYAAY